MTEYYSYGKMVEEWGYKKLLMKDIGSYEGDWLVLVQDGGMFGFVSFGYGSCSGCDELESISYAADKEKAAKEYREFREGLRTKIIWKSKQNMIDWLKDRDVQETKFYWYESEAVEVLGEMVQVLEAL